MSERFPDRACARCWSTDTSGACHRVRRQPSLLGADHPARIDRDDMCANGNRGSSSRVLRRRRVERSAGPEFRLGRSCDYGCGVTCRFVIAARLSAPDDLDLAPPVPSSGSFFHAKPFANRDCRDCLLRIRVTADESPPSQSTCKRRRENTWKEKARSRTLRARGPTGSRFRRRRPLLTAGRAASRRAAARLVVTADRRVQRRVDRGARVEDPGTAGPCCRS
jgi:hypothetical protein